MLVARGKAPAIELCTGRLWPLVTPAEADRASRPKPPVSARPDRGQDDRGQVSIYSTENEYGWVLETG